MFFSKKECIICHKEFNPTNGRQKTCEDDNCKKEQERNSNKKYQKEYRQREDVKPLLKKISKNYYSNNREKVLQKSKEKYSKEKEIILDKRKDYREKNPDKVKECKKISYQKNIIKNNERGRIYNQNPERKKKNSIRGLTRHHNKNKKRKCEKCNETENLEFHHPEPYEVNKFKVLCKKHHLEEHNGEKDTKFEDIFSKTSKT